MSAAADLAGSWTTFLPAALGYSSLYEVSNDLQLSGCRVILFSLTGIFHLEDVYFKRLSVLTHLAENDGSGFV